MINITDVITHLQATTGFIVDYSRDIQPSLEYVATPIVYVGFFNLRSTTKDSETNFGAFNVNGEEMIQHIETHLVCPVDTFYANFKILYKNMNQYNPITSEAYRTALVYTEGGVVGLDNGIQRHVDRWRIGFSTVSNDF